MSALTSGATSRFRVAANEYCAVIDARGSEPPATWLARVHAILPELYAAALALPETEPDTEDPAQFSTTHEEWRALYDDLTAVLGRWNYHWDVYDPYHETDHEAVCGSLADDLADIYRDLRDGLRAETSIGEERPADVLWDWRFDFRSHWAAHATGALRALATAFFVHHADAHPEARGKSGSPDSLAS